MPYGWGDPGLSQFCAAQTANIEHSNAYMGLRLPNAAEYFAAATDIAASFWRVKASSRVWTKKLQSLLPP